MMNANSSYLGTLCDLWNGPDPAEVAGMMSSIERWLASTESTKRFRDSRGKCGPSTSDGWQEMAALGLAGLCVPQEDGGLGMLPAIGALAAEVIGRHLTPEPYLTCSFLPSIYLASLPRSQPVEQLLAGLAGGSVRPVVAVDHSIPGTAAEENPLSVRSDGHGLVLSGTRSFVYGAAWATHFIVPLSDAELPVSMALAASQKGMSVKHVQVCDGTYAADLHFDKVRVPDDAIIASGDALRLAAENLALWAKLGLAAELMGVQSALFGMTLEYIKTRMQFGRELASFQVLQHRCVDLYCHKEVGRYLISEALHEANTDAAPGKLWPLALRCKARAASSGQRIAREAVQMHGAIGFSDECDVSLYLSRTLLLSAWGGGADASRRMYFEAGTGAVT